ncbi:MAG: aldo/keto reductase [Oscillospiraceae bacterium]|nr:aldo/keto reductase [Oscillospiraceae bacterium]
MSELLGKDVFKLGFGFMRLPKLESGEIDIEQTKKMVDLFVEGGGTYFDTAYVYDNGMSEEAIREAVVKRYPRESFTIATKLNAAMHCNDEESAKQQLFTSLERTGAGYFDFYLLHALQRSNIDKYNNYHLWDFVKKQKEKGLIRHWGFSFHSDPELLDQLFTEHPDAEFVQLQINYADWENPGVKSRECYEIARKHGKEVVIMEPIKGGALANPVQEVKDVFAKANPDASCASWAVRYAASLDGVLSVLSGMSNLAQMEDNMSYMKDFKPLSDEEQEVIRQAQVALRADNSIKCTACHYCTDGCPMSIPIPEIFQVWNNNEKYHLFNGGKRDYQIATMNRGKASDCIECGQCEAQCPQHLEIIELLKECRSFEA